MGAPWTGMPSLVGEVVALPEVVDQVGSDGFPAEQRLGLGGGDAGVERDEAAEEVEVAVEFVERDALGRDVEHLADRGGALLELAAPLAVGVKPRPRGRALEREPVE